MDFLEKMNAALGYIESHLEEPIDYDELARLAGCSEYHFSRMFPFLTGQSLSLYIRRRRLSQAALELRTLPPRGLLDLAVRYGYSSVDAFRRAFKEVHGVAPGAVGSHTIRLYPRLVFQLNVSGVQEMVYRLVEKERFYIVGISQRVPLVFTGPNPAIDAQWRSLTPEVIARWKALPNTEPRGILSASTNFSEGRMTGQGTLDHHIGVATTSVAPESSVLEVEAGTWAVFEVRGPFPATLQTTWGRIYAEWFPASTYELRKGPEILWNEGPDTTKPDFHSELWIPVSPKS